MWDGWLVSLMPRINPLLPDFCTQSRSQSVRHSHSTVENRRDRDSKLCFLGGYFLCSCITDVFTWVPEKCRIENIILLFSHSEEPLLSLSLSSAVYTARLSSVLRQYQSPWNVTNLHLEEHVCHFLHAAIKTSSLVADMWVVEVCVGGQIFRGVTERGRNVIPGIGWTCSHAQQQNESLCLTRTCLLSDMPDLNQAGKHGLDQQWCHSRLLC